MATDKTKLSIYIDPEQIPELKKLAAKAKRSLSNYVECLILEEIEKQNEKG